MKNKERKVSFAVNKVDVLSVEDANDAQFSLLKIKVFSDAVTSHKYKCSLDTLKRCSFTILEKPVLVYYNRLSEDFEGHEDSLLKQEIPCGFVPKNSKLNFDEDENGVTYLVVEAYVWKLYFEEIMAVFERDDGVKDVSVELLIVDSEEKEGYTEIKDLTFTGITLLGNNTMPACPGAKAEVVKFSDIQNDYNRAKLEFEQKLYNSNLVNEEPLINTDNDGSFLNKEMQSKEENMEENVLENSVTNTPETLDNGEKVSTVNVSVSEYTDTYDDNGNFVSSDSEYHSKSTTTVEKVPDENLEKENTNVEMQTNSENEEEVLENGCGSKEEMDDNSMVEKCSTLELKCSQLETELSNLKTQYSTLELKCSSLEEYKCNKENEFKIQSIECALNDVAEILTVEQISLWREKSLQCANVDQFKNELKAFAFDLQKVKGVQPVETLRNSIPLVEVDEPTNMWDRLAKQL
jgi:hypothetical protein